jgi:hypothetical protein
MDEDSTVPTRWAVLIGINLYVKRPLEGCVRDVEIIKEYLETGSTPMDIVTLTASAPAEPNSHLPANEPDSWPTYENVTSRLERITERAKPGDFVYIHFSGHGTRNGNTGGLDLVLFDDVSEIRYLDGKELATLVNEMVKKRLFVTLVLDCCFSGSVVRHGALQDAAIRTIAYDPAVDAMYPRRRYPSHEASPPLRDARILPKWLIDPDGYTILTACGPHEVAEELTLRDGKKSGALSYFLVEALTSLRKRAVEITHESLYRYLCLQLHVNWPKQYPMCYGNRKFHFLGEFRSGLDTAYIQVFTTQDGKRLHLRAGHAHGVCEDDEYALSPLNSPEDVFTNARIGLVRVKVVAVRGLTSDLVGIEPTTIPGRVKTGWKARPLTSLSPRKVLIGLMANVGDQAQWMATAKQRGCRYLVLEGAGDQGCLFNVTRNKGHEYEILDESHRQIISLPAIPSGRDGALDCVVDTLIHLAAFKYFEGIENRIPKQSLETSIELHLNDEAGRDLGEPAVVDIKHGDLLSLTVENLSQQPLYLAIFDLGPSWQVDSLLSQSGGGGFVVLPKNEGSSDKKKIPWKMYVPETFSSQGRYQCEDILKVFVTSKPSSFAPLLLPKVPSSAEDLGWSVRGDRDRLSTFLSELTASFRGPEGDILDGWWTTWNFHIRTTAEKHGFK